MADFVYNQSEVLVSKTWFVFFNFKDILIVVCYYCVYTMSQFIYIIYINIYNILEEIVLQSFPILKCIDLKIAFPMHLMGGNLHRLDFSLHGDL